MTRDCSDPEETVGPGAYFDQAAATWDDNPRRVELAGSVAEAMCREMPLAPDMRIMDFGCGTGLIARQLAPKVASVTASDTSTEMLAVLARKAQASGLANVETLRLESGYPPPGAALYNVIVCSMVLHHVQDIPVLLGRFAAWLRPGGWVAVADLEREDGTFHADSAHVVHHGIDPSFLAAQMKKAGFAVKSIRTVHTVRKQPKGATEVREYPVFLLTAQRSDMPPSLGD